MRNNAIASADTGEAANSQKRVLVTGASGYVALHCVQQLLKAGYLVRGTVRSLNNASKVDPLRRLEGAAERLELVEADLVKNTEIWPKVISGCQYVLHVASPWPIVADESTIQVAVNGTLTVLRAAYECGGVKKVVLTSSCAAINDGHWNDERVFDESCWTNIDGDCERCVKMHRNKPTPPVDNYAKSKTLAERAAWAYWRQLPAGDPRCYAFTVLNPTFIVGPVLSDVEHGSATIVGRMMDMRTFLAAPKACLGVVDVRDVARAHLLAIAKSGDATDGQRILITHQRPVWFAEMVEWLTRHFARFGYVLTPIVAPNWLLRLYARIGLDAQSSAVVHRIGPELRFSNKKSVDLLRMKYLDPQRSLIDMVYSMIEYGMIKNPPLMKFLKSKRQNQHFFGLKKSPHSEDGHNIPPAHGILNTC